MRRRSIDMLTKKPTDDLVGAYTEVEQQINDLTSHKQDLEEQLKEAQLALQEQIMRGTPDLATDTPPIRSPANRVSVSFAAQELVAEKDFLAEADARIDKLSISVTDDSSGSVIAKD